MSLPSRIEPPIQQDSRLITDHQRVRDLIADEGGIVDRAGVSRILGTSQQNVSVRHKRGTLPEPVAWDDKLRPMWLVSQIMNIAQ